MECPDEDGSKKPADRLLAGLQAAKSHGWGLVNPDQPPVNFGEQRIIIDRRRR